MQYELLVFLVISSVKGATFRNVTLLVGDQTVRIESGEFLSRSIRFKSGDLLVITHQTIPRLPANSMGDLLKIRNLTLTNNGIEEIYSNAFRNCPKLEVLSLAENRIEEVKNGVFMGLSVKELDLQKNLIARIAHKAFNQLRLRKLSLQHNRIARWNREWFTGSSISLLNFGFNLLEDLPENSFHSMAKSKHKMHLLFDNNNLRVVDRNVFNGFEEFATVSFASNNLVYVRPGIFDGVKYIHTLNLNNNSIYEISVDLLKHTIVDVLMLEDNRLRCMSTDLFTMKELDIDGNPISCGCVKSWLDWRNVHSDPSIYHIVNLEENCL